MIGVAFIALQEQRAFISVVPTLMRRKQHI